jgi:hypothetical protein
LPSFFIIYIFVFFISSLHYPYFFTYMYLSAGRSGRAVCGRSPVAIVGSNPTGGMDFVCCVLSGRGLCDGLITCPEEAYRLRCVIVCVITEPSERGGHSPRWAAEPERERKK